MLLYFIQNIFHC